MSRSTCTFLACVVTAAVCVPLQAGTVGAAAAAEAPAAGNIVVSRIGDGTTALSSAAAPVFLDEYTAAGMLVRTTALPTAVAGPQRRLTLSGSASSEGALALSADGRYVTLAGYDAAVATASVGSTAGTAVNRVVGRFAGKRQRRHQHSIERAGRQQRAWGGDR